MGQRWGGAMVVATCGVLLLSGVAGAVVSEEARCTIVKLKAAVKELKDKAQCYERSVKMGAPVEAGCLARAEQKRARLFERAEQSASCRTTQDGETIGTRIDAFLRDVTRALEGGSVAAAIPSPSPSVTAGVASTPGPSSPPSPQGSAGADEEPPAPSR